MLAGPVGQVGPNATNRVSTQYLNLIKRKAKELVRVAAKTVVRKLISVCAPQTRHLSRNEIAQRENRVPFGRHGLSLARALYPVPNIVMEHAQMWMENGRGKEHV